jgi:16S rRNA (uracil1498-N3)-methyltransferase
VNAVFFHADLAGEVLVLAGPEGRHAALVRRVRAGEELDLVDGAGGRVTGEVVATTKDTVTVRVVARLLEPAPMPRLTVVQALTKGDRGELAVELMTEVGVDEIVPWAASRCVVQWRDERGAKALERWRSTAREAAKQARRSWFPSVSAPATTTEVAALPGLLLLLHESATLRLTEVPLVGGGDVSGGPGSVTSPDKTKIVLVVGPEGGITDEELEVLGGTAVRLGPTVLRASTAGAAAAAVVSSRVGRW